MKHPSIYSHVLTILAGITLATPAFAIVTIDYVGVGNAGNAADTTGYGSVGYSYNIGKHEVTNRQYAEFLNAKGGSNNNGIYNSSMSSFGISQVGSPGSYSYNVASGFENKPVVYVSWYDAARFTNWLGNGQGSGSMETGAYTLSGNTGIITVNVGATVWIPSEDEWYKAAYFDPTLASAGGYWSYPTQSDQISISVANYSGSVGSLTDVGSYAISSFYGTFDQGGNVLEWNDAVVEGTSRGLRGDAWNFIGDNMRPLDRSHLDPTSESSSYGFRLASIPEPSIFTLVAISCSFITARRRH
jgi:sulfatase modifying factor 1